MLFFSVVPLTFEAFFTACNKFVHPGRTKLMSLLRQPRDSKGKGKVYPRTGYEGPDGGGGLEE